MYKPSKRMVAKGIIPERDPYFNEKGYEYTFYLENHQVLADRLRAWLDAAGLRNVGSNFYKEDPIIVIGGMGWQFEIYRTAHEENAVTYNAFFSKWEYIGTNLTLGDRMNQVLTGLETTLLSLDPLTWLRELPMERHVTNGIMSRPEKWEAKAPKSIVTDNKWAVGTPRECYLADALRAMGFSAAGGSAIPGAPAVSANPMIEVWRRRTEEKLNTPVEEPKRFCTNCGQKIAMESKFCPFCGAPVKKTLKEREKEEPRLKKYPPLFVVETGEDVDPFVHARIDENRNIMPEPEDHVMIEYPLASVQVYARRSEEQGAHLEYQSVVNRDNFLYVTDSRIALINRKYNKDEAGSWIGFGSLTAMVVSQALTRAEQGIKAAQRRDKALAGHIRYEWFRGLYFKHKQKALGHEMIRILYQDMEKTVWTVQLELAGDTDAEALANDILRRAAAYRAQMIDEKDEKLVEMLKLYMNGQNRIPINPNPEKLSGVGFPEYYYASRGLTFRPGSEY